LFARFAKRGISCDFWFMQKVYAEVGFGNDTFCSTEVEEGDTEYRIPKFVRPAKVTEYYLRLWIGRRVLILSTRDWFKIQKKDKAKLKILIGIGGEGLPFEK
jgi:hypothetical protein